MSFIGSEGLKRILRDKIQDYNEQHVENAAYELSLGGEYYVTNAESGKKEFFNDKNTQLEIKPGQFALLITHENVQIPNDYIGFISIKFSQKIKGLVNVSGFHVDPGFKGKIIFSVYNAGAKSIILDKGERLFQLWLAKIKEHALPYNGGHKNQNSISAKQIEALKGQLASPNVLAEKINELGHLKSRNQWLLTFLIVLVAGLVGKLFWNWDQYSHGFKDGLEEKRVIEKIQTAVSEYPLDSIILSKVDSIVKLNSSRK